MTDIMLMNKRVIDAKYEIIRDSDRSGAKRSLSSATEPTDSAVVEDGSPRSE